MTSERPAAQRFDPRLPFTRADGRRVGITDDMLLARGYHKALYDSWVSSSVLITPRLRAEAVLRLAEPGSRLSHHTAAELWGAVVPKDPYVHVVVPTPADRLVRKGVHSHWEKVPKPTRWQSGLPVSGPDQAFLELAAAGVALVDLVVAADSMITAGAITPEQLIESASAYQGRNCRVARRAAGLARTGVDSPMETRVRLLIVLAGLPEPRVNLVLRGSNGDWQRRFDLAYEDLRLIVEYDGRQHAEDSRQWRADIYRREELDQRGWRLIVVTAEDIYRDPEQTLERIRGALAAAGAVKLRRTFKDEWRLHFPTR